MTMAARDHQAVAAAPVTMTVQRDLVPLLLGPGPIIVVATQEESTAATLLSRVTSQGGEGVEFVVFHPAANGRPAILRRPGSISEAEAVPLRVVPSAPTLLAALTADGRDALGALRSWWETLAPSVAPEIVMPVSFEGPGPVEAAMWQVEVYRRLVALAIAESRRSARREGDLSAQLYELRMEYERARGVLDSMQEQLERLKRSPWSLTFVLKPGGDRFVDGVDGGELRQPLPVAAEALAAIDLHSPPNAVLTGDGFLAIALMAQETDERLGGWVVPYRLLHRGWIRCALPSALAASSHSVELVVRWITAGGQPPRMSLAEIGAAPELSARCGNAVLGNALAMLLWGGTPGSKLGANGGTWVDDAGQVGLLAEFEYALGPKDFARIEMTTPDPWAYAHPLPEGGGFRLHPLDGVVAGTVLPSGCLPGTDRIVATVAVSHASARFPVEFAMCVRSPEDGLPGFPDEPERDSRVHGFSGWTRVCPDGEPAMVIVELVVPLRQSADLLFATRLPDGASLAFEWADWLEVRLRVHQSAS